MLDVVAAGRAVVVVGRGAAEVEGVGVGVAVRAIVGWADAELVLRGDVETARVVAAGLVDLLDARAALVIGAKTGRDDEAAAGDEAPVLPVGRSAARPIPTATAAHPATASAAPPAARKRPHDM